MDKLREKLIGLDLSDRETDVYLAVLVFGKGTVSDIARKAKIKRTTVYEYIESLLEKGLIYKTAEKKRIFYCVENPEKIVKMLENIKKAIDEKKQRAEKIIPDLQSLYSASFNKPVISFYEGKQGIRRIYEEMADTHKDVYSIFSPTSFFKLFSFRENHELLMKLYENGGMMYNLVEKSDKAVERLKRKEYDGFVKNKLLPEGFKFETDLLIVGDTVAMVSFKNLVGVIIKDKAIADLQKNIFNLLWKNK
ncbi:MAG: helix-turn-helix domain-containing protein [Candidatus Moranbacteria bacterium]|nr:helix-turn-helix domain-containing protein [bacterium]MDP1833885.1 helix-turn-helix domain-containing protein [Candidatus Moranbacteria bacterium]MDZ4385363.1 helix-turn-helix domain-containing protein [Candidatus Moranbacteria bacterium]